MKTLLFAVLLLLAVLGLLWFVRRRRRASAAGSLATLTSTDRGTGSTLAPSPSNVVTSVDYLMPPWSPVSSSIGAQPSPVAPGPTAAQQISAALGNILRPKAPLKGIY